MALTTSKTLTLPLTVAIPNLLTVTESNHDRHWRVRQGRAKSQREVVQWALRQATGYQCTPMSLLPVVVLLTRISPRGLDTDNLVSSQKHVRDAVAEWLGVDDRTDQVTWDYAQRRGVPHEVGVEVTIAARA